MIETDTECPSCDGIGYWDGEQEDPCTVCKGSGLVGIAFAERFRDEQAEHKGRGL